MQDLEQIKTVVGLQVDQVYCENISFFLFFMDCCRLSFVTAEKELKEILICIGVSVCVRLEVIMVSYSLFETISFKHTHDI